MSTLKAKARAQKAQAETYAKRVRRSRSLFGILSFLALVLAPTGGATFYFNTFAADQYASEFRFAVRGRQNSGGADALGMMLGAGSALASSSDSYIVVDYVHSLEMIRALEGRLDLEQIYRRPSNDSLHRYNGSAAAEDMRDYWEWMVDAEFDMSRGIITATVWSFTPEDSLKAAQEVLALIRDLVDQLSQEARQESLSYADEQVSLAAKSLRSSGLAIQEFRNRENVIDPTADVVRLNEQIALLERTIIELTTERDTQIATKGTRSASVQQLNDRIEAARRQLILVSDSIDGRLPELARIYESLRTEQEIARETYAAALRARHEAEAVATQRQVYLSVYDPPKAAQTSLYPDRPLVVLAVFVVASLLWGIFYVIALNIRDAAM